MSSLLRTLRRGAIARRHGASAVRYISTVERLAALEEARRARREQRGFEKKVRENRDQERAALDRAAAEPGIA